MKKKRHHPRWVNIRLVGLCDHHEVDSWFKEWHNPLRKDWNVLLGGKCFHSVTKEKHNANPTKVVFGIDGPKSPYFQGGKNEITVFRQNVLANVTKM